MEVTGLAGDLKDTQNCPAKTSAAAAACGCSDPECSFQQRLCTLQGAGEGGHCLSCSKTPRATSLQQTLSPPSPAAQLSHVRPRSGLHGSTEPPPWLPQAAWCQNQKVRGSKQSSSSLCPSCPLTPVDSICHHGVTYVLLSKAPGDTVTGAADGAGPPHYSAGAPWGTGRGPPPGTTSSLQGFMGSPAGALPTHLSTLCCGTATGTSSQKLHLEWQRSVPCTLGSWNLKGNRVDGGWNTPPQGAAFMQAGCEQMASSASMHHKRWPAEFPEHGVIHRVQRGHTAPPEVLRKVHEWMARGLVGRTPPPKLAHHPPGVSHVGRAANGHCMGAQKVSEDRR